MHLCIQPCAQTRARTHTRMDTHVAKSRQQAHTKHTHAHAQTNICQPTVLLNVKPFCCADSVINKRNAAVHFRLSIAASACFVLFSSSLSPPLPAAGVHQSIATPTAAPPCTGHQSIATPPAGPPCTGHQSIAAEYSHTHRLWSRSVSRLGEDGRTFICRATITLTSPSRLDLVRLPRALHARARDSLAPGAAETSAFERGRVCFLPVGKH